MIKMVIAIAVMSCASAVAQLRVGVVRMDQLFGNHAEKIAYSEQSQKQLQIIRDNPRKNHLNEKTVVLQNIEEEARALIKILNDPPNETEKEEAKGKFDTLMTKRQQAISEYKSAQQEYEEFTSTENKKLSKEMAIKMRSILDDIVTKVQEVAKSRDMDYVFEISGSTSTGISVLPFVKESEVTDITADVLALIKK